MEYRLWQLRFIQWLDTQPSGTFVNLCGGPWGKTTLANMNDDPMISYYHSLHQLSQLQEDLQNGKKAVFVSICPLSVMNLDDDSEDNFQILNLKNLSMKTYELEEKEGTIDYLTFADEYE